MDIQYSVVIPAFNAARWIAATLESWVAQTDQRFEVILVDDGSTDSTLEVAARFDERLRMRIVRGEPSGGPAKPRNVGISLAQSELIVMCDADDLAHPTRLEKIGRAWEAAGRVPCVLLSDFAEIDSDGNIVHGRGLSRFESLDGVRHVELFPDVRWIRGIDAFDALLRADFHRTCSLAFTRSAFRVIGSYDESLRNGQDYDAILRLMAADLPLVLMTEMLGSYRLTPGSISSRPMTEIAPARIRVLEKTMSLVKNKGQRKLVRSWMADVYEALAYEVASSGATIAALRLYTKTAQFRFRGRLLKGVVRAFYRGVFTDRRIRDVRPESVRTSPD